MSNQTRPALPVRPPRACIPTLPAVSLNLTPTLQGHLPGEPKEGRVESSRWESGSSSLLGEVEASLSSGCFSGRGGEEARPLGKLGGRPACSRSSSRVLGKASRLWWQTPSLPQHPAWPRPFQTSTSVCSCPGPVPTSAATSRVATAVCAHRATPSSQMARPAPRWSGAHKT